MCDDDLAEGHKFSIKISSTGDRRDPCTNVSSTYCPTSICLDLSSVRPFMATQLVNHEEAGAGCLSATF